MVSRARHLPSRQVRVIRAIWLWMWSWGSPSRLVPCSQEVTMSPAASNRLLAAVDPDAVVAGAGDPGPGLQVLQRGPVGPEQDLLKRLFASGPVGASLLVSVQAGAALVFPQGGVQHRDRLGEGNRDVVVGGGLPGRLGGFAFEFDEPFGGGVRLGR
jgi:hypothetical protein